MNISGPAAVAKPEMLFYAPGDLTVTFYLSITSFMQDTARVKSLIQCRDYPWFMRLLCGENGGSRENKTQKQNSKTQKEYESL